MGKRRFFLLSIAVAAAMAAGYGAYWSWGAGRMDRTVEQWIDGWRASGYTVLYAEKTVSGFPGAVQVRLREPVVADPSNSWSWSADELVLAAEPWAPTRYRLIADGRHRANLPIAGRKVALVATAAKAEGVANFDLQGDLRDAEIVLERVEGTAPALGAAASAGRMTVMLTQAANPARTHDDQQAAVEIVFQDLTLPETLSNPLGRELEHVSARAKLLGPLRRTDLRSALEGWRDSGGTLDLPWLQIDWGPLRLRGEGTAALDDTLRPIAAVQTRIAGFTETLDALAAHGFIAQEAARLGGLALRLLARRPQNGGRPELAVPISVQEGDFYLGPVKLGSVPPVLPPGETIGRSPPPPRVEVQPLPKSGG